MVAPSRRCRGASSDRTDSPRGVLHDVGTILPASGKRLGGPLRGLDVPTLKGVWENAPYLHDGRAATLREIFTKFNPHDQLGRTSNLTAPDLDQLVAYLQQLDDVPEPRFHARTPGAAWAKLVGHLR